MEVLYILNSYIFNLITQSSNYYNFMVYILLKLSFQFNEYSFFKANEISKLMHASKK